MLQITNPKRFWLIIIVIIVVISLLVWHAVWGTGVILKTGDISVDPGTSAGTLWQQLVKQGYSDRTLPWKWYGRQAKANQKLQAGTYHVDKGESIHAAVQAFVTGATSQTDFSITYPEGFTLSQIGARTAARGLGTEADFKAAAMPAL
jgi:cell division protein YceG involved in septum cleavage